MVVVWGWWLHPRAAQGSAVTQGAGVSWHVRGHRRVHGVIQIGAETMVGLVQRLQQVHVWAVRVAHHLFAFLTLRGHLPVPRLDAVFLHSQRTVHL